MNVQTEQSDELRRVSGRYRRRAATWFEGELCRCVASQCALVPTLHRPTRRDKTVLSGLTEQLLHVCACMQGVDNIDVGDGEPRSLRRLRQPADGTDGRLAGTSRLRLGHPSTGSAVPLAPFRFVQTSISVLDLYVIKTLLFHLD